MTLTTHTQELLGRIRELLPVSEDEIVQRGITETIAALRQRASELTIRHGSLEALETRIATEGVPASDHTLYADRLEWRAVRNELEQLTGFVEVIEAYFARSQTSDFRSL